MKFVMGKKLGMSQIFDDKGKRISVTLVDAGPCVVTQIKTKEKDGYEAIQLGFVPKTKRIKKSEKGKEYKYLKEFSAQGEPAVGWKIGDTINASIFQEGDIVKVTGISKGKGFAGVVKRWGFHGRPATHGMKHEERAPGSVGSSGPGRVFKGKKLAGHYGAATISIKNLKIAKIDRENNILALNGSAPGPKGGLLEISN